MTLSKRRLNKTTGLGVSSSTRSKHHQNRTPKLGINGYFYYNPDKGTIQDRMRVLIYRRQRYLLQSMESEYPPRLAHRDRFLFITHNTDKDNQPLSMGIAIRKSGRSSPSSGLTSDRKFRRQTSRRKEIAQPRFLRNRRSSRVLDFWIDNRVHLSADPKVIKKILRIILLISFLFFIWYFISHTKSGLELLGLILSALDFFFTHILV